MTEQATYQALVGTTLGDYHLEQLLEQHALGPIFLASSKAWQTSRVVRFLSAPARLTSEARMLYLGNFQQEANRVSLLKHTHILPLLDYGVYQGMPYLVYPHIPLISLRTLLGQSVPNKPLIISRYLDQLASALEHAHQHAVLHRNLSTANIFMQQHNDSVVIAEFGVMYMLEQSKQGYSDKAQEGSSESVAPEQLQSKHIDTYTDIYALGAVLYRMITGHPPFGGKTREEINKQHLYAEVPPVSTWRQGVPERVDYIITKAMAKEPAQRFSRPAEMADAFHDVIAPNDTARTPLVVAATLAAAAPALMPSSQPLVATPSISATSTPPMASLKPGQYARALPQARQASPTVSRRRLITLLATGGGIAAAATVGIVGWSLLHTKTAGTTAVTGGTNNPPAAKTPAVTQPTTAPATGGSANVLARTADIPVNSAKKFAIANQNNPGLLIHLPGDTFVAYDSTCTHAGCAVNYVPQSHELLCPCHGAIFDPKQGAVIQGPAQTPLAAVKIVVHNDGTITKA